MVFLKPKLKLINDLLSNMYQKVGLIEGVMPILRRGHKVLLSRKIGKSFAGIANLDPRLVCTKRDQLARQLTQKGISHLE